METGTGPIFMLKVGNVVKNQIMIQPTWKN